MSFCPVCNGFSSVKLKCPKCQTMMTDSGKLSDYFGDYSPYREIEHLNMTNGIVDVAEHQCTHIAYCSNCGYDQMISINELNTP